MVGHDSQVESPLGAKVVVGDEASVVAEFIEDSVVLSGAKIEVKGTIRHCVLAGHVQHEGDLDGVIAWGDERN